MAWNTYASFPPESGNRGSFFTDNVSVRLMRLFLHVLLIAAIGLAAAASDAVASYPGESFRRPSTMPVVTTHMKRMSEKGAGTAKEKKKPAVKTGKKNAGDKAASFSGAKGKKKAAVKKKTPAAKASSGKKASKSAKASSASKTVAKTVAVKGAGAQSGKSKQPGAAAPVRLSGKPAGGAATDVAGKAGPNPVRRAASPHSAVKRASGPAAKTAAASGTALAKEKGRTARQKGVSSLRGFSSNPFELEEQFISPEKQVASRNASGRLLAAKNRKEESRISVSGKTNSPPDNRLIPHRGPFTGGPQTLPYMDKDPQAEVSMEYKLSSRTSTKVVVNPQDEASPLYRPAESDKRVSAGGLYMDYQLAENLQLKVGGEYSEVENQQRMIGEEKTASQGAAVGLQWSF